MEAVANNLLHNSIAYLSDIASCVSVGNSTNLLKSYYLNKCSSLSLREGINLGAKFTNDTVRCPKCCISYADLIPKFNIVPEKHKSKFGRRLLKKDPNKLTSYQRKYIKHISNSKENTLLIKCNFCMKEIKKPLLKPNKAPEEIMETIHKSKKKRRKDRFSGLKPEIVLAAAALTNASNLISTPQTSLNNSTQKSSKKKLKKQKLNKDIQPIIMKTPKEKKKHKNKMKKKLNQLNEILNSSSPKKNVGLKQFLDNMQK